MSIRALSWFRARNSVISVRGGLTCLIPRAA